MNHITLTYNNVTHIYYIPKTAKLFCFNSVLLFQWLNFITVNKELYCSVSSFLPLPLAAPDFLSCRCRASRFVWSSLFLHIPDTLSTASQGQQPYQRCPLWLGALFSCSEALGLLTRDTHELRDTDRDRDRDRRKKGWRQNVRQQQFHATTMVKVGGSSHQYKSKKKRELTLLSLRDLIGEDAA